MGDGMRKIAVFTTSDIFTLTGEGTPRVTTLSTGVLEAAVALGYEVFVMSTRRRLGAHDEWWLRLLPRENVFLGQYGGGNATDKPYIKAWRELAETFGLNPDTFRLQPRLDVFTESEMAVYGSRQFDHAYEPTWLDYMLALYRHGIAGPQDFQPRK